MLLQTAVDAWITRPCRSATSASSPTRQSPISVAVDRGDPVRRERRTLRGKCSPSHRPPRRADRDGAVVTMHAHETGERSARRGIVRVMGSVTRNLACFVAAGRVRGCSRSHQFPCDDRASVAGVQGSGIDPALPVCSRRRLQHLQRPTSSDLASNAANLPCRGIHSMEHRRRSRLNRRSQPDPTRARLVYVTMLCRYSD
jgi:hypothetical protein